MTSSPAAQPNARTGAPSSTGNASGTPAASASDTLTMIAVLIAAPGQREALRDGLAALVTPTRAEPGNLDYTLLELQDEPGTFYMRETFRDEAALEAHRAMPHFQAFAQRAQSLLAEPLRLIKLTPVPFPG